MKLLMFSISQNYLNDLLLLFAREVKGIVFINLFKVRRLHENN